MSYLETTITRFAQIEMKANPNAAIIASHAEFFIAIPDDYYIFQSNGCPGISDSRLVASRVISIMLDDLWLIDSARTEVIQMRGSSPNSWFSAFETDPEVDKILGY